MGGVTAQPGIFALGTTDHGYLELNLDQRRVDEAVRRLAGLVHDLSTTSGASVVVGIRPSLWRAVAGEQQTPADAEDWLEDVVGADGFRMPATQRDVWVWVAAGDRTAVFEAGRVVLDALSEVATLDHETTGWLYRHDRDLTGFIDGTENPGLLEAPAVATVAEGEPGAGGSVVLHQLWRHDTTAWEALGERGQELAMGRTKPDSVELDDETKPNTAHVARTVLEVDGQERPIFRRNVAYGGISDHGTVFVGFSREQWRLAEMLRRMAGVGDGVRDSLTRYTTPLTGAYYVVPSVEALLRLATAPG
jgi:putative iron-dependent peroxidase